MNERIRELAEQAWDDTREKVGSFVDDGGEIDFTFFHAYDQKFAELIVRECAKFMDENSGYDDSNNAWHPEPEDMLKHFGVEE
jgi:hypothetical protein